jgi:hypothetical protein
MLVSVRGWVDRSRYRWARVDGGLPVADPCQSTNEIIFLGRLVAMCRSEMVYMPKSWIILLEGTA